MHGTKVTEDTTPCIAELLPFNFVSCIFHKLVHVCVCVCPPLQRWWSRSVAASGVIQLHNSVHQQVQETQGMSAKRWVTDRNDAAFSAAPCAARGARLLQPVSAFLLHLWVVLRKSQLGGDEERSEVRREALSEEDVFLHGWRIVRGGRRREFLVKVRNFFNKPESFSYSSVFFISFRCFLKRSSRLKGFI